MAVTIPKDHFPYFIVGICFESHFPEAIGGPFYPPKKRTRDFAVGLH